MKKVLCLVIVLVLCMTVFVACASDMHYIDGAAKNADDYEIVASYDSESHKISATQVVTTTNRTSTDFDALKFHIYANCYREGAEMPVVPSSYSGKAYPNGTSYGDITFDSVKVGDETVAYIIEGTDSDILSVPTKYSPNKTVVVTMVYEVQLANILHRLGFGDNTVNLGNFYPVLCTIVDDEFYTTPYYSVGDPFVTDIANYDVTITVPEGFMVASTGANATAEDAESQTYNFKAKAVRDFAMVLSKDFQLRTYTLGDTTLNYYYFCDSEPEVSMATIIGTMQFMEEKVAKYPYSQISVVETDFCFDGMEFPNIVFIKSGSTAYQEAIAHEIIHQWFYGVVGNNQIENAWMDEGLTEFLTMMYMDYCSTEPLKTSVKKLVKSYTQFVDVLNNYYGDKVDTSLRPVYEYKNDQEYVYMTYVKGSLMFYRIYDLMGEAKFCRAVQKYYDTCKMTIATPEQLILSFGRVHGADLTVFFDQFMSGKEIVW